MKIVFFAHSLVSCWNHGNAHFLRGVCKALQRMGHSVTTLEPANGWSRTHLVADRGRRALAAFTERFPTLRAITYKSQADVEAAVCGAELVIVHEWTEPAVLQALGRMRAHGAPFTLLYHDTHHRAVSDANYWSRTDLSGYDGILAFGESLAEVYRRHGWGDRAYVWHEAADTDLFRPMAPPAGKRRGVVWIGNWGDGERTAELSEFLIDPVRALGLPLDVYGVRYPAAGREILASIAARYHGWIANADVPRVFASHVATVHVPRRYYARNLPGIPTIRVFEALASGLPLVSAPWTDSEGLFRPGEDYLVAQTGREMRRHLRAVFCDAGLRAELMRSGPARIQERHTCAHRAEQLMAVLLRIKSQAPAGVPA